MKLEKDYNIGLDIGTCSVGYCVTDEDNNIIKKDTKNMWGSNIFSEAQTAEKTRNYRASKRRIERRKERINILQSLMLEDMEKEYPNFFQRLKETANIAEDKIISDKIQGIKYNLFSDKNITDKDYFHKFPTIYHLRYYLINTTEKVDIRLVYLALHHIIKYRGNFLYENNFSNNTSEIKENLQLLIEFLENKDIELKTDLGKIIEILCNKNICTNTPHHNINRINYNNYIINKTA